MVPARVLLLVLAAASCVGGDGTGDTADGFGGVCSNGKLIAADLRTQEDHCGTCNRGHHMAEKCGWFGWFGRNCRPVCQGFAGACSNGQLKEQGDRSMVRALRVHRACLGAAWVKYIDLVSLAAERARRSVLGT